MTPTMRPRVKICCIASLEEARMVVHHGADAIGLVSAMPSGPGPIPEDRIRAIAAHMPPMVSTFLLTSLQDSDSIIAQHRRCHATTLQICDRLLRGSYEALREALPGIRLVQVIHVLGEESITEAVEVAPRVDAILLDSGTPQLPTKRLGGTGRTHDWAVSRRIREAIEVPLILAGGLTPGNVAEAIRAVGPYAVDVCTGVRTDGALDGKKLAAFIAAVECSG